MSTPHLYSSVLALIFNEDGQVLLIQRQNTGYYNNWWNLVSGNIESGETAHQAMLREIKGKVWLDITLSDMHPHHVLHRLSETGREYIDVSFVIDEHEGTPSIAEPDEYSALERFDLTELPEYMPPENFIFLEAYLADNKWFSEIDLRSN